MAFTLERRIAELAVQRASRLAKLVADSHNSQTITKSDESPVTVADFGAQAAIIAAIKHVFPQDKIVGEEDAGELRKNGSVRTRVWNLIQETAKFDDFSSEIGQLTSAEEMLDAIDQGNYVGGSTGRMWALDPIDGTKGFIRKGQYAVCLALIVDSQVKVGVIGCPNLALDPSIKEQSIDDPSKIGVLFSSLKSKGSFQRPLFDSRAAFTSIAFKPISSCEHATFCESVESGHSAHDVQAAIAKRLGITKPSVRMDSQAKYCSISRGDGDIYLRLPVNDKYEEKIWDHAAGNLLVSEAGGKVTDMYGKDLDFGVGRTLKNNKGVIAAYKEVFDQVLSVVKEVTAGDSVL